jgi:hypothetical protein
LVVWFLALTGYKVLYFFVLELDKTAHLGKKDIHGTQQNVEISDEVSACIQRF